MAERRKVRPPELLGTKGLRLLGVAFLKLTLVIPNTACMATLDTSRSVIPPPNGTPTTNIPDERDPDALAQVFAQPTSPATQEAVPDQELAADYLRIFLTQTGLPQEYVLDYTLSHDSSTLAVNFVVPPDTQGLTLQNIPNDTLFYSGEEWCSSLSGKKVPHDQYFDSERGPVNTCFFTQFGILWLPPGTFQAEVHTNL